MCLFSDYDQGRGIGIAIGCIIGMFPLLFIDPVDDDEKEHSKQIESVHT